MEVAGIEPQKDDVSEGEFEDSSSVGDGRDSLDDVSVQVAVVVLWEVYEIGRA